VTRLPVDHLIYAAPDLAEAIDRLDRRLGVRPAVGGRHPAWGTHNAILSLGPRMYLELLAADPEADEPTAPRPLGLDDLAAPRLVTWVAAGTDLERLVSRARLGGVDLGGAEGRSRQRPDDTTLSWMMTDLSKPRADGLVPFFIDWEDSPHPGADAPGGCHLIDLRAEHPHPVEVRRQLAALSLPLPVARGPAPRLIATLATPRGTVELA
jgi:hypothetical protein